MNYLTIRDQQLYRAWGPANQLLDTDTFLAATNQLFTSSGEMPHQNPCVLLARLASPDCLCSAVYFWPAHRPHIVLAFRQRADRIWQSLFPGAPILANLHAVSPELLAEILTFIQKDLCADALYFPLAYPETSAAHLLAATPGIARWDRSPSSIISWDDAGTEMYKRFHERYGSQAVRKRKKWQDHLQARTLSPQEAIHALACIETFSWKAAVQADLGSSGQLDYYQSLLLKEEVELMVATHNRQPIAYRLDSYYRNAVYVLEWSFDSRYAALAPGMFLIVEGLVERWGKHSLSYIDLFGAPDILKSLVETNHRARVDLAWPAGMRAQHLCLERTEHDQKLLEHFNTGTGVHRIYGS